MVRRAGLAIVVATLSFTGLSAIAGTEPALAGKAPVDTGSVRCGWRGTIKFSPRLITGGTTPATATFRARLRGCEDFQHGGPAPGGITGGTIRGTFALPTNDCALETFRDVGASTFTVRWKPGKVARSVVTTDHARLWLLDDTLEGYFDVGTATSNTQITGSFSSYHLVIVAGIIAQQARPVPLQPTPMEIACMPKTAGVPGSGGLAARRIIPLALDSGLGDSYIQIYR